jgi:nuclease HARBI1
LRMQRGFREHAQSGRLRLLLVNALMSKSSRIEERVRGSEIGRGDICFLSRTNAEHVDDYALQILVWARRRRKVRRALASRRKMLSRTFSFESLTPYKAVSRMRFEKRHIAEIARRIRWKRVTGIGQMQTGRRRYTASCTEATCILLWRLAMPSRVEDLEEHFYRSASSICELFYEALECLLSTFGSLLHDFNAIAPLLRARSGTYARAIAERAGNATQRCVGFIDGTVIEIAKPSGLAQRATYSGHKRRHALKWQAITGPDGIILNLFGPVEGRRHDMHLFHASSVEEMLAEYLIVEGQQYHLYADAGYVLRPYMLVGFTGTLTPQEQAFNRIMSRVRVAVEWAFKDIKKYFCHSCFARKMVLSQSPVSWYLASALLWNFRVVLYGSSTFRYFDVEPPILSEYLGLLGTAAQESQ